MFRNLLYMKSFFFSFQFAGRSKKESKYSLKAVEDMLETLQITQS